MSGCWVFTYSNLRILYNAEIRNGDNSIAAVIFLAYDLPYVRRISLLLNVTACISDCEPYFEIHGSEVCFANGTCSSTKNEIACVQTILFQLA